jgi:circadian clock protein KaiC
MQSTVSGFKLKVPSLEDHAFSPGTIILLTGRPGVGKSIYAQQFCWQGLEAGQAAILALTDTTKESIQKQPTLTSPGTEVVDFLSEKPRLINEVSIAVHQLIDKHADKPVRFAFDSLSTLGTMFNAGLLAPWLLDQRSRFLKQKKNLMALIVYDTGINPPSITRSLQALSDIVLEMKFDETTGELMRLFRIYCARGAPHSTKWFPFTITDSGINFGEPS